MAHSSTLQSPEHDAELSRGQSIPSLEVDYDELDADDPPFDITWFQTFTVFGFSGCDSSDPRYKALSKFKRLATAHGIADLRLIDYYRALLVFAAFSDKKERAKAKARKLAANVAGKAAVTASSAITSLAAKATAATESTPDMSHDTQTQNDSAGFGDDAFHTSLSNSSGRSTPLHRWFSWPRRKEPQPIFGKRSDSEPVRSTSGSSADNDVPSVSADHVRLLYHMLRHAESIYGLPLTLASAPMTSMRKLSGVKITTARNQIPESDIVHSHFTATTFSPAHYVAVDRNIKAVVVCIRGTANILDSLTDITATHDPIRVRRHEGGLHDLVSGYGHSGVLRSARNVFDLVRRPALDALLANREYELLLTGHSLGAAIAAVVSLIMRDDPDFPHALAVCIAPPPCLSLELAEETVMTAVTLVNGPDIVPRLSVPVLLPFLATARYVADLPHARRALVAVGLHSIAVQWDELREECEKRAKVMRENHEGKDLFIPGAVFQMVRMNELYRRDKFKNSVLGTTEVRLLAVQRDDFVGVRGREKGMFLSHAPYSYRSSLGAVLRSMGASKLGKSTKSTGRLFRALTRIPIGDYGQQSKTSRGLGNEPFETVDGIVKTLYVDALRHRSSSISNTQLQTP